MGEQTSVVQGSAQMTRASSRSCVRCGAETSGDAVSRVGAMETYQCSACGLEQGATISMPDDIPILPEADVEVVVRWRSGRPTASELASLRAVHEPSGRRSMSELLHADGVALSLGVLPRGLAMALREAAAARGLDIVLKEIR